MSRHINSQTQIPDQVWNDNRKTLNVIPAKAGI